MKKVLITLVVFACFAASIGGCTKSSQISDTGAAQDTSADSTESEIVDQGSALGGESETAADSETDEVSENQPSLLIEPELLISRDEATQLVGETVGEGEKSEMVTVGQKIVFYDPEQEGSLAFLQISLTQQGAMPAGSSISPDEMYKTQKDALDETSDLDITGIGDDCFTGTPGLHILYRGYLITIGAGNTNDADVQERLAKAGQLAVENLEKILSGQ